MRNHYLLIVLYEHENFSDNRVLKRMLALEMK
jgi:hypothetical protein